MPSPFPHHYKVDLEWKGGSKGDLGAESKPLISGGPPPEFDGDVTDWSPEHLLLSAANLCLMTTFMAVAKKARLTVNKYQSHAEGTLEKTDKGIVFTSIELKVSIDVADEDKASAERCLGTAKKYCIVSNALNVPVHLNQNIGRF